MTRKRKGIRLEPCPISCQCMCHDSGGGYQEFHEYGICDGKFLTNSAADIKAYQKLKENK